MWSTLASTARLLGEQAAQSFMRSGSSRDTRSHAPALLSTPLRSRRHFRKGLLCVFRQHPLMLPGIPTSETCLSNKEIKSGAVQQYSRQSTRQVVAHVVRPRGPITLTNRLCMFRPVSDHRPVRLRDRICILRVR
jgi:hypothetical protein